MKLSALFHGVGNIEDGSKWVYRDEREVSLVTDDSRKCIGNSLFVAIGGSRLDGASFIPDAHKRGARFFVALSKIECPKDSAVIYSKNPRKTLAELLLNFYAHPETDMIFVGITGTKGKTTTGVMLKSILDFCGIKSVLIGSLGVRGVEYPRPKNTTPGPTEIAEILSLARDSEMDVAIIEASSQALKDFRLHGIPFHTVAFTGLGSDHVGGCEHSSAADYARSKRTLFTSYGASCAVVNSDDSHASYISDGVRRVVGCGFSEDSEMQISSFSDAPSGSSFILGESEVRLSLPGEYNVRNAAIALVIAREITGRPIRELAPALRECRVDGRFEIYRVGDRRVIVDYAHNKDSFNAVCALTRRLFDGRIICVFGSVGDRAEGRRGELAVAAERWAYLSVITSDDSGGELPISICAEIYSAFGDKSAAKIITDRKSAIEYALSVAKSDDTVLILGRGEEGTMHQNGKVVDFSDVEFIKALAAEQN
ncbi:MAG: UDP-N-acetylmuramyl-tripeptide synthetase [Clostridia bacterium]|nr:UDP-N-acetylmuramyl-tripeptide synthetase [Clostridia bacterium]